MEPIPPPPPPPVDNSSAAAKPPSSHSQAVLAHMCSLWCTEHTNTYRTHSCQPAFCSLCHYLFFFQMVVNSQNTHTHTNTHRLTHTCKHTHANLRPSCQHLNCHTCCQNVFYHIDKPKNYESILNFVLYGGFRYTIANLWSMTNNFTCGGTYNKHVEYSASV